MHAPDLRKIDELSKWDSQVGSSHLEKSIRNPGGGYPVLYKKIIIMEHLKDAGLQQEEKLTELSCKTYLVKRFIFQMNEAEPET